MEAKIISSSKKSEEIDLTIVRLMQDENGVIILTTGVCDTSSFQGTVILGNEVYETGTLSDSWKISRFTPFDGSITIEFNPE